MPRRREADGVIREAVQVCPLPQEEEAGEADGDAVKDKDAEEEIFAGRQGSE